MKIGGIEKSSFIDYPGIVSAVLFSSSNIKASLVFSAIQSVNICYNNRFPYLLLSWVALTGLYLGQFGQFLFRHTRTIFPPSRLTSNSVLHLGHNIDLSSLHTACDMLSEVRSVFRRFGYLGVAKFDLLIRFLQLRF